MVIIQAALIKHFTIFIGENGDSHQYVKISYYEIFEILITRLKSCSLC